jgi:hypothetical protein
MPNLNSKSVNSFPSFFSLLLFFIFLTFSFESIGSVITSKDNTLSDSDDLFIYAFISHGQSWRSQSLPIEDINLIPDIDPPRAFAPNSGNSNVLLPSVCVSWIIDQYLRFGALSWKNTIQGSPDNAAGNIGFASARAFSKLSISNGYAPFDVLDVSTPYPAYDWNKLRPGTEQWECTLRAIQKIEQLNNEQGYETRWLGIGWTHGVFSPDDTFDYFEHLQEMVLAFDKLNIGKNQKGLYTQLHYYIDMYGGVSDMTVQSPNTLRQLDFALSDPSRFHLVNPRYPYKMNTGDNIHHNGKSYVQYGEVEGLAKFKTLIAKENWVPFRILDASIKNDVVTLNLSSPMSGFDYPSIDTNQIELAPQFGFHVKSKDINFPIREIKILDTNKIELYLALNPLKEHGGVEVSYAWHGPGASFGTHSGVWGNIKRQGPPSVFFVGETIDLWLCNFKTVVYIQD